MKAFNIIAGIITFLIMIMFFFGVGFVIENIIQCNHNYDKPNGDFKCMNKSLQIKFEFANQKVVFYE